VVTIRATEPSNAGDVDEERNGRNGTSAPAKISDSANTQPQQTTVEIEPRPSRRQYLEAALVVRRPDRFMCIFFSPLTTSSGCRIYLTAIAAVASKTKRPVRCMLDRSEDIQTSGQRHPFLVNWNCTSEGKILALQAYLHGNGGYSLDISGGVMDRALTHVENCLHIPNVDVCGRLCKTNTVSNTAFRGFGAPQVCRFSVTCRYEGDIE
jgi:hypothetical protein